MCGPPQRIADAAEFKLHWPVCQNGCVEEPFPRVTFPIGQFLHSSVAPGMSMPQFHSPTEPCSSSYVLAASFHRTWKTNGTWSSVAPEDGSGREESQRAPPRRPSRTSENGRRSGLVSAKGIGSSSVG